MKGLCFCWLSVEPVDPQVSAADPLQPPFLSAHSPNHTEAKNSQLATEHDSIISLSQYNASAQEVFFILSLQLVLKLLSQNLITINSPVVTFIYLNCRENQTFIPNFIVLEVNLIQKSSFFTVYSLVVLICRYCRLNTSLCLPVDLMNSV